MTALDGVKAELLSVRQLFLEDTHYEIPIYQRNYAWGQEEIHQLIDDILDAASDSKVDEYFLGNLIVSASSGTEADPYAVIDGQQRLTTLFMLLTFLHETDAPKQFRAPRFQSRKRATSTLSLLGTKVDSAEVEPGISAGYRIIEQYGKSQKLREHIGFILKNVRLVRMRLAAGADSNRYFEIMNTRGEQLQQQDIVKARMMSQLTEPNERACFAWLWDACTDMETYVQMPLARGSTGKRTDLFGKQWDRLQLGSFDDVMSHTPEAFEGAQAPRLTLYEAIEHYARRGVEEAAEEEGNERFSSIISFPSFLLHVLNVLNDVDEKDDSLDDKKLVRRFSEYLGEDKNQGSKSRLVKEFAVALVECRLAFDAFILKREFTARNADDGAWSLKRFVRGESKGKSTPRYVATFPLEKELEDDGGMEAVKINSRVRLLQSALRVTYTSPRTMHWVTCVLRLVREAANLSATKGTDLLERLENYAREKIRPFVVSGDLTPHGFDIPRIVFTYLDYLLAVDEDNLDFQFIFRNSIEHFYPQSPNEDLRHKYGELKDPALRDVFGNLALVTVSDNSKFSNDTPARKADYERIIPQSPKLKQMAHRAKIARWLDEEITTHHNDVVARLSGDLQIS